MINSLELRSSIQAAGEGVPIKTIIVDEREISCHECLPDTYCFGAGGHEFARMSFVAIGVFVANGVADMGA